MRVYNLILKYNPLKNYQEFLQSLRSLYCSHSRSCNRLKRICYSFFIPPFRRCRRSNSWSHYCQKVLEMRDIAFRFHISLHRSGWGGGGWRFSYLNCCQHVTTRLSRAFLTGSDNISCLQSVTHWKRNNNKKTRQVKIHQYYQIRIATTTTLFWKGE